MKTYVSFLRAVNVTGYNVIKMTELKKLYEALGFTKVTTYIQSGNVIFEARNSTDSTLIKKIKNEIKIIFGLDIDIMIRSLEELEAAMRKIPFQVDDEGRAALMFLSDYPKEIPVQEIEKVKSPGEQYLVAGKELYLYCPDGFGKTKLTNTFWEKKLKVRGTARNLKTVKTLLKMAKG